MFRVYKAYSDSEHGWLRVTKKELEDLGLMDKISKYSYEDKEYIYLEEDLDAGVFLNCKKDEDIEIQEDYKPVSPIRKLKHYRGGMA
jgi:hypothetical protein